jgi:hypothetical protein
VQRSAVPETPLDNSKLSTGSGNTSAINAAKIGSPSAANASGRSNVPAQQILLSPNKASPKWHKREILPPQSATNSPAAIATAAARPKPASMGPPISAIRGVTANTTSSLTATSSSAGAPSGGAGASRNGSGNGTSTSAIAASGNVAPGLGDPASSLRISTEASRSLNGGNDDGD